MRILFLLVTLIFSYTVYAETYLVFQVSPNARVVLAQNGCLVKGLTGSAASVQRTDGRFIRGCWRYVDNGNNVRIDWDNPAASGDFAVIRAKDFSPVNE